MTFPGVPWFIGGGAENPPEAARLLAHVAGRGDRGVLTAADCVPSPLAVPGGGIRIGPGALILPNGKPNAAAEAYLGRNPDDHIVIIPPTGGSARSDLIYYVIRDPQYSDEPDPASVADGPYEFVERVPVPAGTKTVADAITAGALPAGITALELARVDLPASTGTVTQAHITDLRSIPAPRSRRRAFTAAPTGTNNLNVSTWATFPPAASWTVSVPAWATHAVVHIVEAGLVYGTNAANGGFRVVIGTGSGALIGQTVSWSVDAVSGTARGDFHAADTLVIPAAMRGTNQTLAMQGARASGSGVLTSNQYVMIIADIEFQERVG